MESLIEELKKFRNEHCIVGRIAAHDLKITERTLLRIEGNHNEPSAITLKKIKHYLRVKRAEIARKQQQQIEAIKNPLIEFIYAGSYEYRSLPRRSPAHHPGGILVRIFYLKDLVKNFEVEDSIIVKVLEILAKQGKIKIFHLTIDPHPGNSDFKIVTALGKGVADPLTLNVETKRLFKDDPLSDKELENPEVILNLTERIEKKIIRKQTRYHGIYGTLGDGSEVEKQLRKEDEEDERAYREMLLNRGKEK